MSATILIDLFTWPRADGGELLDVDVPPRLLVELGDLGEDALVVVDADHLLEEHAGFLGEMHADITSAGSSRHLANATIAVWGAEDGGWRLAAFQSTRLPE